MRAWAEEAQDPSQTLLLFDGDLAALAQIAQYRYPAPLCRIERWLPGRSDIQRDGARQSLPGDARIDQRSVVVGWRRTEGLRRIVDLLNDVRLARRGAGLQRLDQSSSIGGFFLILSIICFT